MISPRNRAEPSQGEHGVEVDEDGGFGWADFSDGVVVEHVSDGCADDATCCESEPKQGWYGGECFDFAGFLDQADDE